MWGEGGKETRGKSDSETKYKQQKALKYEKLFYSKNVALDSMSLATSTLSFENEAIMPWWQYGNDALTCGGGGMGMMPASLFCGHS